jgi:hypothetical protein
MKNKDKDLSEDQQKEKKKNRERKQKQLEDSFDDTLEEIFEEYELYTLLKNMRD